jgi:hypothetical protein
MLLASVIALSTMIIAAEVGAQAAEMGGGVDVWMDNRNCCS